MINKILLIFISLSSVAFPRPESKLPSSPVTMDKSSEYAELYNELDNTVSIPSYEVFSLAVKGYQNLKKTDNITKNILTIIDLSLASTEKRLWVIDMDNRKILFNDLVAHGKNSGDNLAGRFSNQRNSNMSSLGFYITGSTYSGCHGLSLLLDGKDKDYNNNARDRAIVVHGAAYVSNEYIKKYGRIGRSFGCPALSLESYQSIINAISGGSCMFIYYPDEDFIKKSNVLNGIV